MDDWKNFLDQQLKMLSRYILKDKGKISHAQAIEKAEKEFEIYRAREMRQLESGFDRAIKKLRKRTEEDEWQHAPESGMNAMGNGGTDF